MISFIYQTLTQFGYTHPLHPTITHLPIGMVMGAFIFILIAQIYRKTHLAQTARNCCLLALIGALPTVALGIMDWQHFYNGSLLFPIKMKMALAGILVIFLTIALIFGFFGERYSKTFILMVGLALCSTIGLGYFGGELVYATKAPAGQELEGQAAAGAAVFNQNCSVCHFSDSTAIKVGPGLKGLFKGDKLPVSGWAVTEENFRRRLREPFDKMPPFGHLPPEQVEELIAYLKTL
jgi:mono/diheme cytochrome c family protein